MKRILYIQAGVGFLHVNKRVIAELQKHFPGCEIELFDLLPPLKRDYVAVLWNSITVLREYFTDFLFGRKSITSFRYHFLGTTYLFGYFSRKIGEKVKERPYDLILQTQCLCDSSGNGIPNYIYTDHTNLNNLTYRWTSPHRYLRTKAFIDLERKAFQRATGIFVMSENVRQSLIHQYGLAPEKITMAYVGSNTTLPNTHDPGKYRNKNVIFVGKDWERKGGPLLVEAFRKVLSQVPDATLSIVGCKPDVQLKNCRVFGEVSLQEVAQHYQRASVFCFPTVREPFGVVYIEAMMNKLPIVTNHMGAAPSLVTEKNGYLLEHDADAYSHVLVQLLNDPERCRLMGEESYRLARTFYNWTHVGTVMAHTITNDQIKASLVHTENSFS